MGAPMRSAFGVPSLPIGFGRTLTAPPLALPMRGAVGAPAFVSRAGGAALAIGRRVEGRSSALVRAQSGFGGRTLGQWSPGLRRFSVPRLGRLRLMRLRFGSSLGLLGPRSGLRGLGCFSPFASALGAAFLGLALALPGRSGSLGRSCSLLGGGGGCLRRESLGASLPSRFVSLRAFSGPPNGVDLKPSPTRIGRGLPVRSLLARARKPACLRSLWRTWSVFSR